MAAISAYADNPRPTEPKSLREAQADADWPRWLEGMIDEKDSLETNFTWELVDLPAGCKALNGKWVFKHKRGVKGKIKRWKARWVIRGFKQREGINYSETFASVVKPMSYKAMFAIAAALSLYVEQMDVKTAFLYGDIDGVIYVVQPHGLPQVPGRCAC